MVLWWMRERAAPGCSGPRAGRAPEPGVGRARADPGGVQDNILAGGVALTKELDGVPEGLATTDRTVHEIAVGAARYAGSVAKLLG